MRRNNRYFLESMLLVFLLWGFMITTTKAGIPLWTFNPLTPTSLTVAANGTAIVQYRVTNQSMRSHTLVMNLIPGVTQLTNGLGVCGNPFVLGGKGSCILSLQVNGSQLIGPVAQGPIVCQGGNPNQCYGPSAENSLHITPSAPIYLYGVTGDGSPSLPESLFTILTNSGQATFVMSLGNGTDGEVIASDALNLYHWSGNPGFSEVIYERIDLANRTTTIIPLSGAPISNEVSGAVFYSAANGFLITNLDEEFLSVTRLGFVSLLGNTQAFDTLRGMACFAHRIYAIQRNPAAIVELSPTGLILNIYPDITMDGYVVTQGIGLTVHPVTGVFYVLLGVQGSDIRKLATIDIPSGVATEIGDVNNGTDLRFSSIAFHPADPTC